MDPLDFLEPEQLLQFYHCKKTELSCIEKPHTFLSQLTDHNLIPEDRYKKVSRMKSKENIKKELYGILDWLEKERAKHIHHFWRCVFKQTIMNEYPVLRMMHNSLMDGSFQFDTQLPEKVEEESDKKRKEASEDEDGDDGHVSSVKKKRKRRTNSVYDDDDQEQPGHSSSVTPGQRKKPKKPSFSSPLKKGEKSDFCSWELYRVQLPVTCGDQEGVLCRDKLARGEKCIVVKKKWFTPTEFERFAGKQSSKNWKLTIRCMNTPLGQLIKEGHLKHSRFKQQHKNVKKSLFPSDVATASEEEEVEESDRHSGEQTSSSEKENSTDGTDEEEEEGNQTEQQPGDGQPVNKTFKVTCGDLTGTLHTRRFASGIRGKSIRTEASWMSPVDFVKEGSSQADASWKKEILCDGKPLARLIKTDALIIHSELCTCRWCSPAHKDLEDQKNDDECLVCKSKEEEDLVECDHCPRSFHQTCHQPHVADNIVRDHRPWMCTFCVFRMSQEWRCSDQLTRESALSRQILKHMLQHLLPPGSRTPRTDVVVSERLTAMLRLLLDCQYLLLYVYSADENQVFAKDPSLYLPDYTTMIKNPMWLDKIADKLHNQHYRTVGEFVSDMLLIFSNCASYNKDNAEFHTLGNTLRESFERELKNGFNIL